VTNQVPLWSVPETYGNTARWSFYRWRWEFYRRRIDLQAVFEDVSASEQANGMGSYGRTPRGQPGHYVMVGTYAQQEFGYCFLPDPTVGNHPEELLWVRPAEAPLMDDELRWGDTSAWDDILPAGFTPPTDIEKAEGLEELLSSMQIVPWHKSRFLLGFNLDQPIEPQLMHARIILQNTQRMKLGRMLKPQTKRRHPKKWFGYLRTLDARSAGATWAEIAQIHPQTARTEQTARDIWKQACELCFNF